MDKQQIYNAWKEKRASRPIPKGMRFLTADDIWQAGDEWFLKDDVWHTVNKEMIGQCVEKEFLCYTPRGSTERKNI